MIFYMNSIYNAEGIALFVQRISVRFSPLPLGKVMYLFSHFYPTLGLSFLGVNPHDKSIPFFYHIKILLIDQ